jgi:hypothetical protein
MPCKKESIVVYTAVLNNYDFIIEPKNRTPFIDFICFTDDPEIVPKGWECRHIDEKINEPKVLSGKHKILPHKYLDGYKYSVWVDGNICIHGNIREMVKESLKNTNLSVPSHPNRSCIYDESKACIEMGKASSKEVGKQMQKFRKDGFPANFGLSETRVIVRRHMKKDVKKAMEKWWEEFKKGASRDQLSFEYAAWKCNLKYQPLEINYYQNGGYLCLQKCYDSPLSDKHRFEHRPPDPYGQVWGYLLTKQLQQPMPISIVFKSLRLLLLLSLSWLQHMKSIYFKVRIKAGALKRWIVRSIS